MYCIVVFFHVVVMFYIGSMSKRSCAFVPRLLQTARATLASTRVGGTRASAQTANAVRGPAAIQTDFFDPKPTNPGRAGSGAHESPII